MQSARIELQLRSRDVRGGSCVNAIGWAMTTAVIMWMLRVRAYAVRDACG